MSEKKDQFMFDADWYKNTYSIDSTVSDLFEHYNTVGWRHGFNPSPLFDQYWYLSEYPDLAAWKENPFDHFLRHGNSEGRNPCLLIDNIWFKNQIRDHEVNPIAYFRQSSESCVASPHPLINIDYLNNQTQDNLNGAPNAFYLYMTENTDNDLDPNVLFSIQYLRKQKTVDKRYNSREILTLYLQNHFDPSLSTHPIFDGEFYRRTYADAAAFNGPCLLHYALYGEQLNYCPHILFDTDWVRRQILSNQNGRSLVEVYINDRSTGISPHPLFDEKYYLDQAELHHSTVGLIHYIANCDESSKCHPLFDGLWYTTKYSDLHNTSTNPLIHYLEFGWKELRNPNGVFNEKFYSNIVFNGKLTAPGLLHYVKNGARHRGSAHPLFDEKYYSMQMDPTDPYRQLPLAHYLLQTNSSLNPHEDFENSWYIECNMRHDNNSVTPLEHFTELGISTGFNPAPWINLRSYRKSHYQDVNLENISEIIKLIKTGPQIIDDRISSVGIGLTRHIEEQLEIDPTPFGFTNVFHLVNVQELVRSVGGNITTGRAGTTIRMRRPIFSGDKSNELRLADFTSLDVYVAEVPNVIGRSTSRLLGYEECKIVAYDEMANCRCRDASSKLYGIDIYQNNIYFEDFFCTKYIETGIHLMNEHDANYFHWVVEMLPRLMLLTSEQLSTYPIVLSDRLHQNMYDLLDLVVKSLAGDKPRMIKVPDRKWIKFGTLIYPSDVTYIPDVYSRVSRHDDVIINVPELHQLRQLVLSRHTATGTSFPSKNVYFERKQGIRRILNEDALIAELQLSMNLDVISAEKLSFRDQVALFNSFDLAIMPTGASLTNILWCKPGAKIICLFSDHPSLSPYLWQQLADIAGVNLIFVRGARTYDVTNIHSVHDNYVVPAYKVLEAIG